MDITPEKLEKFEQTGKTKADRILITFLPEDADELAAMLGLEKLEKVLYRFEELKK